MLRRKDAFEKWLMGQVEKLKVRVRGEVDKGHKAAKEGDEADAMQHSVMRICYESGRDLMNEVLTVYCRFKKGDKIDE